MKALLLDVGNSRIKWGLLDAGTLRRTGSISRQRLREDGLQVLTTRLPRGVDTVFASNVGGANLATRLSGVVSAHCGCEVHFARTAKTGSGLTCGYSQPRRMGVDRWVAMVGAWRELGAACLVVDAGTAVTIDAIDGEGRHLGGQIIPGVATMASSLSGATSDIPPVATGRTIAAPDASMFASSTAAAVREGALNAIAGAVDRAFRTLQSIAYDPVIVLTGGDASRILNALCETPLHRPHLVLQGLATMLENAE